MFNSSQLVTILSCSGVVSGILLIFYYDIRGVLLNNKKKAVNKGKKQTSELYIHLENLLTATSKNGTIKKNTVDMFLFLSGFITVFLMVILIRQGAGVRTIGTALSVFCGALPYVYLRIKKFNMQYKASYEVEALIQEILNQYRICNCNMIMAIDNAVKNLAEPLLVKKYLYRLSLKTKNSRDKKELRKAIDNFANSIDTDCAKMLANNMLMSLTDGTDVTEGMEDLLKDCRAITMKLEQGRRANAEAFTITRFFVPAAYAFTIWMLHDQFSISFSDILDYQINTRRGVMLFMAIVISGFINHAVIIVASKIKFDY